MEDYILSLNVNKSKKNDIHSSNLRGKEMLSKFWILANEPDYDGRVKHDSESSENAAASLYLISDVLRFR